ncbi:MAG: hypothetical protein JNG86_08390, partial [Verrucomicrobiaceae bacterium]|nr:hypothetical protein [Verrucomicrobiaceae bacterium]
SFNGFLRNRANNNGSGILNVVVGGTGNQTLALGNINYTGSTTINTGARLTLENTPNFGSHVTNNGTLGLRLGAGTFNLAKIVTGTGAVVRDGGGGTVNITTPVQQSFFSTGNSTITVGTTAGLQVGTQVTGTGIPNGTVITSILNGTQFILSQAPTQNSSFAAGVINLTYRGTKQVTGSLTLNSNTVTVPSTSGLVEGMPVSGPGIPAGSAVRSILSATQFTLSAAATSNQSNQFLVFGHLNNFGGGFSAIDGGTTNLTTPVQIGGSGVFIRGLENLTTLNWNEPVDITAGGITLKGTGDNVINGVALNINSASRFIGPVTVTAADVRLAGPNGGFLPKLASSLNTTTTLNSTLATVSSTAGLVVGMPVAGNPNIPAGATIASIVNGTQITLSVPATAAGVVSSRYLTPQSITIAGHNNTATNITSPGLNLINAITGSVDDPINQNNTDRIVDGTTIHMDGGRLVFSGVGLAGTSSTVFSERLGDLRLAGGSNFVYSTMTNAASGGLGFARLLPRVSGATVTFDTVRDGGPGAGIINSGAVIGFVSAPALDAGGILGGWAVVSTSRNVGTGTQFREFATRTASPVSGLFNIIPLPEGNYQTGVAGSWTSTNNVKLASAQTVTTNTTINSLNIQDTTGRTLNINGGVTLTVNSGGILSSRGNHAIAGAGNLTAGAASGHELIFHLPTNALNITARVTNNGTNAVSVTKAGPNVLTLNPLTTRATNVAVNNPVLTVPGGIADLVVGAPVTGAGIPAGAIITAIDSGANQITISALPTAANTGVNLTYGIANTYTGRTTISEGTLEISREAGLGANPVSFVADHLFLNGGRLRATSTLSFDDSNRGISIGAADGFISVANNRKMTIGVTNSITSTQGRLIFAGDGNNRGVLEIAGNNDFSGGLETSGADATSTTTISGSFTNGSPVIQLPATLTEALIVGAKVTGPNNFGIPAGATIASIDNLAHTVTLSAPVTESGTNIPLTFDGFNVMRLTGDNTIGFVRVLGSTIDLRGNNTFTQDIFVNTGTLRLAGSNTFSGVLTMNAGEVILGSDTALDSTGGYEARVLGGILNLNGFSTTVSRLSGSGTITNDAVAPSTLTVNVLESQTFTGIIRDSFITDGSVSLVKNGPGVLGLTSALTGYSGATVINGGMINATVIDFGGFFSSIGRSSSAPENLVFNQGGLRYNNS